MTAHEPSPSEPTPELANDQVAALRAAVNRVLSPVEQNLDHWETELLQAIVSPTWTPMVKQHMAELRAAAQHCRELGEAMLAAAAQLDVSSPQAGDSSKEPPTNDPSPDSAPD